MEQYDRNLLLPNMYKLVFKHFAQIIMRLFHYMYTYIQCGYCIYMYYHVRVESLYGTYTFFLLPDDRSASNDITLLRVCNDLLMLAPSYNSDG